MYAKYLFSKETVCLPDLEKVWIIVHGFAATWLDCLVK
jgi:hypothetical protein